MFNRTVPSSTMDEQLKELCSMPLQWDAPKYTVKFMHRGQKRGSKNLNYLRQFPGNNPQWGNCFFNFDIDCKEYDWLVVYHDIPKKDSFLVEEKLACPRERTILITGEPSTITVFGTDYIRQFGCVLTFQEPWAMRHPNVIFTHPGLPWFYGSPVDGQDRITWDQIAATSPPDKTQLISTVCSERTNKVTLHTARVDFTWQLKDELKELDIFGHGVNPMNDKAEVLDPYMYHIAVENHVYQHHLTEKLPDAFLGYCLPFYHGAPNTSDFFPKESFIPIDINDSKRSIEIIKSHIANNEYADRLPYIIEARRRVLEEENLFAILNREICKQEKTISSETNRKVIRNRSTMRIKNPLAGIRSITEKAVTKTYHRLSYKTRNKPKGL